MQEEFEVLRHCAARGARVGGCAGETALGMDTTPDTIPLFEVRRLEYCDLSVHALLLTKSLARLHQPPAASGVMGNPQSAWHV